MSNETIYSTPGGRTHKKRGTSQRPHLFNCNLKNTGKKKKSNYIIPKTLNNFSDFNKRKDKLHEECQSLYVRCFFFAFGYA